MRDNNTYTFFPEELHYKLHKCNDAIRRGCIVTELEMSHTDVMKFGHCEEDEFPHTDVMKFGHCEDDEFPHTDVSKVCLDCHVID